MAGLQDCRIAGRKGLPAILPSFLPAILDRTLMDLDQLKQILDLVRQHELTEFEVEHDGLRLKIRKDAAGHAVAAPAAAVSAPPFETPASPQSAAAPAAPAAAPPKGEGIELAIVKSP